MTVPFTVKKTNTAPMPPTDATVLARDWIIIGWVGIGLMLAFVVLAFGFLGIFSASTESEVPARLITPG